MLKFFEWLGTAILGFVGTTVLDLLRATGVFTLLLKHSIGYIPQVSIKETIKQMYKLGVQSLPIVSLTILFAGMVIAIQTSKEFVRFGAAASAGGVVAIGMGRELVPVLTGVVIAGRVGSAIAAEIGSMKVTEQIDALKVMAVDPIAFLVTPRLLACALMLPILVVYGNIIGNLGGFFVATNYAKISSYTYINSIRTFCTFGDMFGGVMKSIVFGVIVAVVGCYKGMNAEPGAEGVGKATISSVVVSMILIFIFNYFLSIMIYV